MWPVTNKRIRIWEAGWPLLGIRAVGREGMPLLASVIKRWVAIPMHHPSHHLDYFRVRCSVQCGEHSASASWPCLMTINWRFLCNLPSTLATSCLGSSSAGFVPTPTIEVPPILVSLCLQVFTGSVVRLWAVTSWVFATPGICGCGPVLELGGGGRVGFWKHVTPSHFWWFSNREFFVFLCIP